MKNIFISMGKLGEETRINLAKKGNLLTFGSYGEKSSAPGQINYNNLHNKIFTTKEVLFLGGPQISGSFSPFMHNFSSDKLKGEENKFFYKLNKIPHPNPPLTGEGIVKEFIEKLESDEKYLGGNVTMPYKIDAYNYLKKINRLEENAELVGAVNTLFKKDGKIFGTNTDLEGISGPILEKISPHLEKEGLGVVSIYILGAGGAARAAISASIKIGIENIYILNRSKKSLDEIEKHFKKYLSENQKIITKIYDVNSPHPLPWGRGDNKVIIINTLPFGFKENLPKSPIKFKELEKILPNLELYFEAVYDSEKGDTPIVQKILSTEGFNPLICRGIEMLIGQAKTGFELWTNGGEFKSEEVKNILLNK
ncbi:MAG: type I 3-dehydroquinate dehydratase [Candidatus Gracilibacteria bacterium]|nr:type I 3-dehydroquinate dehydratase [Candidatus Gracilibacteria bacterium]